MDVVGLHRCGVGSSFIGDVAKSYVSLVGAIWGVCYFGPDTGLTFLLRTAPRIYRRYIASPVRHAQRDIIGGKFPSAFNLLISPAKYLQSCIFIIHPQ